MARSQRMVGIGIGAGTAIPTVCLFGEDQGCPLIRINPDESKVGLARDIGIPLRELDGITRIADALEIL